MLTSTRPFITFHSLATISAAVFGFAAIAGAPVATQGQETGNTKSTPVAVASLGAENGPTASGFVQLMPLERLEEIRARLPAIADRELAAIVRDPRTMWYDRQSMPPAYQDSIPPFVGILETRRSGAVAPTEFFSAGKFRFPFGAPGGAHRVAGIQKINFLRLPNSGGQRYPIVWWKQGHAYHWMFPRGTVIGEVLLQKTPDNESIVFEIRMKRRHGEYWHADAYRPFPSSGDLVAAIQQARPNWQDDEQLAAALSRLNDRSTITSHTLADRYGAFKAKAGMDALPPLDAKLTKQLLTETTFKSCEGGTWKTHDQLQCFAPTAESFSIVPANYDAGLIAVDNSSCRRCHEHAGREIGRFVPQQRLYGQVWGSDETFSWHPFEPNKLLSSPNGISAQPLRTAFIQHGVIQAYDPATHSAAHYQRLPKSDF